MATNILKSLTVIHSKIEKACGTAFSVKKYCGKSAGHFWAILGHFGSFLGHFGHFWAILGHICATLGHFGSFSGLFVAFLEIFAESSIFLRRVGVAGLAFRMYVSFHLHYSIFPMERENITRE